MAFTSASEMGHARSRYSITASTHDRSDRGGPVSSGDAQSSSEDAVTFELKEAVGEKDVVCLRSKPSRIVPKGLTQSR